MIRSTVFNLVFYGFTAIIALTAWVLAKVSTAERVWRVIHFWGWGTVRLVRLILNSRIEMRGFEHIDRTRPQLFVSKHQSELDVILLPALLPGASAVAMQELTRTPFFGTILRKLDIVLVAIEQGPQGRTRQTIEGARRMMAQGRSMMIYPEGELMKLGAKERYRRGAGHLYQAMGVEAVPVAASLGVIWPRREWRKYANVTGAIEFMEPIPPGLQFDAFMAEVERRIETRTMELIEEHATGRRLEEARDRFARGANNERELEG
ncbi:MAG TPA: lysophospholipid acyltransferase family protein [Paracoccaceae bacterium]|nr:lysophospholipid acyltransferase family protein [Paracoccaceae bacterium]